mgnify:CR=1 FL=1
MIFLAAALLAAAPVEASPVSSAERKKLVEAFREILREARQFEVESLLVLASQEVHDISVALGVDPGSSDLKGLRYDKVCVLADADSDLVAGGGGAGRTSRHAFPEIG